MNNTLIFLDYSMMMQHCKQFKIKNNLKITEYFVNKDANNVTAVITYVNK